METAVEKMNDDEPIYEAPPPEPSSWVRKTAVIVLVVIGVLFVLSTPFFRVLWVLLVGWMSFLSRTVPRITWNADLIGMAVLCTAAILGGTHWFLTWLCFQRNVIPEDADEETPWRWRRTWCVVAALGLTFFIGSSMVGAVHQIGWLMSSHEPMIEPKSPLMNVSGMTFLESAFNSALRNGKGDFYAVRRAVWQPDQYYQMEAVQLRQTFHIFAIVDEDNRVSGMIIFPRDEAQKSQWGGIYQYDSNRGQVVPGDQILKLLQRHQDHLRML